MDYYKIIFNADNAWHNFEYGFKIDLATEELEITYDNFLGGYTKKRIKIF